MSTPNSTIFLKEGTSRMWLNFIIPISYAIMPILATFISANGINQLFEKKCIHGKIIRKLN